MGEWNRLPLSDLVTLQRGHDLPTQDRTEGSVPVIGSFGITGTHGAAAYPGPGVAIGRSGAAIGTATYVEKDYWPLNTCLFVRDFKGNYPRWIYYLLDSIDFQYFNSGSAQPSLNRNYLRDISVAAPTLAEQKAIAEVLGALDDKIAANDHASSLSEELIGSSYRHAVISGAPREVPLLEAFEVDFGEPFSGEHFTEPGSGRPLIRIRDLKTFSPQIWTTEQRASETTVSPGDVTVGMDAEFRAYWWLGEPGLLNQRVCRVRGKNTGVAFVAEALMVPLAEIEKAKTGTTVIHLNKSDLARSKILMPQDQALSTFEDVAEPLVQSKVALANENRLLARTRDELLPLLMSGKIRVRDAEKTVEEVV